MKNGPSGEPFFPCGSAMSPRLNFSLLPELGAVAAWQGRQTWLLYPIKVCICALVTFWFERGGPEELPAGRLAALPQCHPLSNGPETCLGSQQPTEA